MQCSGNWQEERVPSGENSLFSGVRIPTESSLEMACECWGSASALRRRCKLVVGGMRGISAGSLERTDGVLLPYRESG